MKNVLKNIGYVILFLVSIGISIHWFTTLPFEQYIIRELIIHADNILEIVFIVVALICIGIKTIFSKLSKRKDKEEE